MMRLGWCTCALATVVGVAWASSAPEETASFCAGRQHVGDAQVFGGGGMRFLTPLAPCSNVTSSEACIESTVEIKATDYTTKLDGMDAIRNFSKATREAHGFTTYYRLDGHLDFIVGGALSIETVTIRNHSLAKLSTSSAEMLSSRPDEFAQVYGTHIVSEVVRGAEFWCSFSLHGFDADAGPYLQAAFQNMTTKVFYDPFASYDFTETVNLASKWGQLDWPNIICSVDGGPAVDIDPFKSYSPLEIGAKFVTWSRELRNSSVGLKNLRVKYARAADLHEVSQEMEHHAATETKFLREAPNVWPNTTEMLGEDVSLAVLARNIVLSSFTRECVYVNKTLHDELTDMAQRAAKYIKDVEMLDGCAMGHFQTRVWAGDTAFLQGCRLMNHVEMFDQACSATEAASPPAVI